MTPDHREQQGLPEQRGHQVLKDYPALVVTPVLAEAQEHLEQPDHQVVKVRPDQVEVPDLQERQVPAEAQVEVEDKEHPE